MENQTLQQRLTKRKVKVDRELEDRINKEFQNEIKKLT